MLKLLMALMRGHAFRSAEAIADANALTLLDQQIRDAAGELAAAKRALAVSMAQAAGEERRLKNARTQIIELEQRAVAALAGGRIDLAREAAEAIAEMENDAATAGASQARLVEANASLQAKVEGSERRLAELNRGRRTAQAAEAVRNLRAGPGASSFGPRGALGEAEATLARLSEKQAEAAEAEAAAEWLADRRSAPALVERLAAEGFGPATKTTAASVLARLEARRTQALPNARSN